MAITFPLMPADGQLHNLGGIIYRYSLVDDKWVAQGSIPSGGTTTPPVNDIYFGLISFDANTGSLLAARNDGFVANTSLDGRFVKLTGDTMTGPLTLSGNPTANLHAVTKQYVDALAGAQTLGALLDVSNTAPIVGQILGWNSIAQLWEPMNAPVTAKVDYLTFDTANGALTVYNTDATSDVVGLDGRYVKLSGDSMTGFLTLNANPTANFHATTKQYVDTLIANSEIYTASATIDANGMLIQTRTDGTVYTVDMFAGLDARYVNVAGDTMTGPLVVQSNLTVTGNTSIGGTTTMTGNVYSTATFFANNITSNGTVTLTGNTNITQLTVENITANNVTVNGTTTLNGDTYTNSTLYSNNVVVEGTTVFNGDVFTTENFYANNVTIDGNTIVNGPTTFNSNVTITETLTTNNMTVEGTTILNGNTIITGTLTAANVAIALAELTDVADVVPTDAQILQYNFLTSLWEPKNLPPATVETYVDSAWFNITTDTITLHRNDGVTIPVSIAGYAKTVNAIAPDALGNVAVSLTATKTGTFAARPATANAGLIYVVSGDSNTSLNGATYIYESNSAAWYEVKGFDTASADARYVNVSGDVMTGALTLSGAPTANLHAATKLYVDAKVANSEIYTTGMNFNANTGVLTGNRNDGVNYTVTVDGRYIVDPKNASNGQVLSWNGTSWQPMSPATFSDTKVTLFNFNNSTGDISLTQSDGQMWGYNIPDTKNSIFTFDNASRNLTLTDTDGNTLVANIPDKRLSDLIWDANTQILTAYLSDGTTKTTFIPKDVKVASLNYNSINSSIDLTDTAGSVFSAIIPAQSLSLGDLTNVDGEADDIGSEAFLVRNSAGLWRAGGASIDQLSDVVTTGANLPSNGQVLVWDSTINFGSWVPRSVSTSGTVTSANTVTTDNAIVRWDGVTGTVIQNSSATLTDQGVLTTNQVFTGVVSLSGYYRASHSTLATGFPTVNLDWKGKTYYKATLAAGQAPTIAFVNPPLNTEVASMTVEVLANGGTMTWPANVKFPNGSSAPTLTTGKTYLFMLTTSDGGVTVLASTLNNYG